MGRQRARSSWGEKQWRLPHAQRPPTTASACSTKSASSRTRAITAGSCRPPRSPSISASAWPTASACSGCRSAAPSAWRPAPASRSPAPATPPPSSASSPSPAAPCSPPSCDWTQFDLGWMYTLFFVLLGVSAAIWGGWLERVGPRKAGVVAALCWGGGLLISAVGVYIHQLWMMWLGSGIIGGFGLGLGYISPVSTLIKWFPDRRGMATGMAIMGFGGGAMIGSPLATILMNHYATPDLGRRVGDLRHPGRDLFCLHARRRLRLQAAAHGLETRRLDAARQRQGDDHHRPCPPEGRAQDRAVLADLGGALPQRLGRHRHHRRRRADVAGDLRRQAVRRSVRRLRQFHRRPEGQGGSGRRGLCRPVLAVQHCRPLLLGLALRQDRAEGDLFHLLHARLHLLRGSADAGDARHARPIRGGLLSDRLDVWRRLCHHPRLSRRHVRHAVRRRHPRKAAHRLVDRRHRRSGDRQLHARLAQGRGRAARPDLSPDLLRAGRTAGGRLHRQPPDQAAATRNGS